MFQGIDQEAGVGETMTTTKEELRTETTKGKMTTVVEGIDKTATVVAGGRK